MKIGVISDTHGDITSIKRAIEACRLNVGEPDAWIHCGDYAKDAQRMMDLTGKQVYYVNGNCDSFSFDEVLVYERVIEICGKRLFICHGHTQKVEKDLFTLSMTTLEKQCDAAIFGHTHIATLEFNGCMLLNPGSAARPHYGMKPSYAVIDIDEKNDRMTADIYNIE